MTLCRRLWVLGAIAWLGACSTPPQVPPPSASVPGRSLQVDPVVVRPQVEADGRVRLAAIFPDTGRYAISGIQSANGARLAVEDLNRRGGIGGRRLQLLEYRTGSYFLDARHAADLAASQDDALAIVGANASRLSMAIAELAEARGIVQISNVSTAHDLTWDPVTGENRRFVFRVCGSDVVMGRLLAKFASEDLEARRVAVLYEISRAYSAQLARSFMDNFDHGEAGRTTEEFFYLPLEVDFRTQLRQVAAFDPDVVFVPGSFTDATLVAMQAESLGLEATLLGADGWSNRLLFKRGGPRRLAFYSDHCATPASFLEYYRRRFGSEPQGCRAILAYDAVLAFAQALDALGPLTDEELSTGLAKTRERLRQALEVTEVQGETGSLRFDSHGDSQRGIAVVEVRREADGGYRSRLRRWLGEEGAEAR